MADVSGKTDVAKKRLVHVRGVKHSYNEWSFL